ncbi:sensor histidine kinase [Microbacterium sp.]|uniref:sensor histidine kinase n=1 Tax=Microbacterium sp. TaxID=51671 RepID=UPI003A8A8732
MTVAAGGSSPDEDDLPLPGAPGTFRRFWSRHPTLLDSLIAGFCLVSTLTPLLLAGVAGDEPPLVPALALLVSCAALCWRRRWPLAVFVLAAVAATISILAESGTTVFLLPFSVYAVVLYRSTRAGVIALAAVTVALVLAGVVVATTTTETFGASVSTVSVATEVLTTTIGALIGINVRNRKRYVEALIDRSRRLLVERDQEGRLATSAERSRIAREMHDIVSHSLTVMVALAEGAAATRDPERARAAIEQVAGAGRSAMRDMRGMLGVLRDEGSAPLAPVDHDAIGDAVQRARRAGFPVTLTWLGAENLPRAVHLAIVRIVQEGVTNAMRHAPHTTGIEVRIGRSSRAVDVTVVNDGVHGPVGRDGYGVRGVRERVEHVGGTIEVGPMPPSGWRVHAVLPLSDSEEDT